MTKIRLGAAALVAISLLAACGSSDDTSDGGGVASLGSTTTVAGGEDRSSATTVDPQEAMLAYTQCMRDEGIDMPDPEFTADGGAIAVSSAEDDGSQGPSIDFESDEFQAAEEVCGPIMDEAVGSVEIDPEQQAEMREQLLEYAECMREQGIDFPDPEFGDNGMVTMSVGSPDDGPMSDAEQDAMDAANETCAEAGGPIMVGGAAPTGEDG